ncbi:MULTISPECIES: HpcH/HpaI aldolase family protein [unclassified Sphingomonas]|uniref:HpcH/HpaI aldolase family protein n=1 Tax=unclassified Sphingomonas TaxID=196159 RepID=UPI0006F71A5C|nr:MULTISPECIES: HpcH/HpaI aldolase/citrate lyase family protein [unclassified Sphingomonas]KQX19134.1 2-dehydro-3-deoxyglucarate aldolase [Sphingomonas sp. Root1294]KQY65335.1 2-dehydro-3-deoxyglucarate aldolase [Sphingomonas sp. Root50]KRB95370.1 2-dehydro-3-deoxyglucarate aldolase [Sphingomonas sp. Root720]
MNRFVAALGQGRPLLGLWQALANPYTAEICAGAGYDWLLIDGEHAPNTFQTLLGQLQAVAAFPVEAVARVPVGEAAIIKQYLDIGFKTLLVPMVESADQARALVAATRFPPRGIRGVASATSRASGFGRRSDYLVTAHEEVGLIVQIESRAGLENLDAIAAVDGVDAVFIGPGDLAASLGHLGNPRHPDVQSAIAGALARIAAAGKPAGIFALSVDDARQRISDGIAFVSLGTDIGLLTAGARTLVEACRPDGA